jgi:TetR/AcrR family transcriptional regulator
MEKSRNVEMDIIEAAGKVFQEKGYKEATMRDIAAEANINLAMLHYYYRCKDNLFYLVFDKAFRMLYENIAANIANTEMDVFSKIRLITREYISFFNNQPQLPPFIVGEIIRNPEKIGKRLLENTRAPEIFRVFSEQLQKEFEAGTIKQITAFTLVINILSLCVFPAISRPVIQEVFSLDSVAMDEILESRKNEVAEFIISAIRI